MSQYRTHTCGELRAADAGKTVTLAGWMENVREVGANFAFVVLRDFYGTTQVVVESGRDGEDRQEPSTRRRTIAVDGHGPRARRARTRSSPPARSRSCRRRLRCSAAAATTSCRLRSTAAARPTRRARLKYRYLDLRNPAVKNNIVLRCNVVAALRRAMMDHGFLEITTPILTASSPEGARDYLVPARKHPGKFYALPQAPQQFKQLLMTSRL